MIHILSSMTSILDDCANCVPKAKTKLAKGILGCCPKRATVPVTEDQVRGIFNRYDTNKDGLLSKRELKNAFASLGSLMPSVRAWLGLQHADVNGDGYISEAEFDKLVKYTLERGY